MEANLPFGKVRGFVFILAWSRYLFVRFYPRSSMEFFLDGHINAYNEIGGAARSNWYDNLSSVVIRRKPELTFNGQFVDYMSHMGVSIHACNPGKGNEKGRDRKSYKRPPGIRRDQRICRHGGPQQEDGPVEKGEERAYPSNHPQGARIGSPGGAPSSPAGYPV